MNTIVIGFYSKHYFRDLLRKITVKKEIGRDEDYINFRNEIKDYCQKKGYQEEIIHINVNQ